MSQNRFENFVNIANNNNVEPSFEQLKTYITQMLDIFPEYELLVVDTIPENSQRKRNTLYCETPRNLDANWRYFEPRIATINVTSNGLISKRDWNAQTHNQPVTAANIIKHKQWFLKQCDSRMLRGLPKQNFSWYFDGDTHFPYHLTARKILRQCQTMFDTAIKNQDYKALQELANLLGGMERLSFSYPTPPKTHQFVEFSGITESRGAAHSYRLYQDASQRWLVQKNGDESNIFLIRPDLIPAPLNWTPDAQQKVLDYMIEGFGPPLVKSDALIVGSTKYQQWIRQYNTNLAEYHKALDEFKQYGYTLSLNPAPGLRKLGIGLMVLSAIIIGLSVLFAIYPVLLVALLATMGASAPINTFIVIAYTLGLTGSNASIMSAALVGGGIGLGVGVVGAFSYRNPLYPAISNWATAAKGMATPMSVEVNVSPMNQR